MDSITTYFRGVIQELKKVKWPTQTTAYVLTALVIALTLLIGAYLGLVDQLTSYLFDKFVV
jgi:preprotein translocase SecE subunit